MSADHKGFSAVRRSWRIVELLVRHFAEGMSNSEIAESLKVNRPTVTRDLTVLEEEGLVHKLDNGRWALTLKPLQLFRAFSLAHERQQSRWSESMRNIDAGARRLVEEDL